MSSDVCTKKLIFWGQTIGTCWFNAILVSTFYSEQMRKLVSKVSKHWDYSIKLFDVFKHILDHKYVVSKQPTQDIRFFNKMTPQKILKLLNNYNSDMFPLDDFSLGFYSCCYIKQFYNFLGISSLMLVQQANNLIVYDVLNDISRITITPEKKFDIKFYTMSFEHILSEIKSSPDVLLVRLSDYERASKINIPQVYYNLDSSVYTKDDDIFELTENIRRRSEVLRHNNAIYKLDSIILDNWNITSRYHSITGITCKNERYVYNGWSIKETFDNGKLRKMPCDLVKYHWIINDRYTDDKTFCLNRTKCNETFDPIDRSQHCFSFLKGERLLIYVKQQELPSLPSYHNTPEHVSYYNTPSPSSLSSRRSISARMRKHRVVPSIKERSRYPGVQSRTHTTLSSRL